MSMKEQFQAGLQFSRSYTTGLFDKFESANEWVYQAHATANHALWCLGHIAIADNFFTSLIAPEKAMVPDGYSEAFGKGSEPVNDASQYPAPEEVKQFFNDRRETLLAVLDSMTEEDFAKPTPGEAANTFPTFGAVFGAAIWHETLHAGQTSIAHRGLNKSPLFG